MKTPASGSILAGVIGAIILTATSVNAAPVTTGFIDGGPANETSRWFFSGANIYEGYILDSGSVIRGDAFDGSNRLTVNGSFYNDPDNVGDLTGTTLSFDTATVSTLSASVQYHVDPTTGMLRTVATLTNGAGTSVNANVGFYTNLGSDGSGIVSSTSSGDATWTNGDRYMITDENFGAACCDPAISFVTHGGGSPDEQVASILQQPSTGSVNFSYNLDVGAGETVRLMTLTAMNANTAGALAGAPIFDSINNSSSLVSGLSQAELDSIVNWDFLPTVAAPEPGALALFGLGLVGIGFMRWKKAA